MTSLDDALSFLKTAFVGFPLHNATEGFVLLVGAIGGAPTLVGTIIGYSVVNDVVWVAFLALATESIRYVVVQLIVVGAPHGRRDLLAYAVLIGRRAGLATDAIVTAAGVWICAH